MNSYIDWGKTSHYYSSMNFKAFIVVLATLALSACGHLRSNSGDTQTESTTGTGKTTESVIIDDTSISNSSTTQSNAEGRKQSRVLSSDPSFNSTSRDSASSSTQTLETIPLPSQQTAPSVDILERIRRGFRFPDLRSEYVADYERWDASHPTYLKNLFVRAEPFLYYIVDEIDKRGLPMELALLPAIESAYKPNAVSRSRAAGLWQFIPSTGRGFGLRQDWWYDGRRDVIASTQAALDYLSQLNTMFDGDWFLTLAAYNAGPGTVSRAIKTNQRKGKSARYTDLNLRSETRRYVPKLIALKNILNNPSKYDFDLPKLGNVMHFEVIELSGQTDIHSFAKHANIDHQTLKHLNPGYKRWTTPPKGPHRLLVPVNNYVAAQAAKKIAASLPQIEYRNHVIQRGENLGAIARRYGVTVNALQTSNNIKGTNIRAGRNLMIPIRGNGSQNASTSNESGQSKLVHRVQRGDTLWSIARRYQVKLQELVSWNNISTNQILKLNQALVVFAN